MAYIKPQKIVKVVKLKRRNVYSRSDSRYYSLDIFPNEIFTPGVLKKKISTHYYMDGWDPEQNLIEFDNNPVSGFSLTKIAGSGNNMELKIKDPRGFDVNISSANLTEISLNSTLSHGVICTKCVWLFDEKSSLPYLALEGTELYNQAMERARQLTTTIDKTDLQSAKTGDCVLLRNGKSAYVILTNDFHLFQRQYDYSSDTTNSYDLFSLDKRKYLYVLDKITTDTFLKDVKSSQYRDPFWHYNHYLNNYSVPRLTRITQSQIVEVQSQGIRNEPDLTQLLNLAVMELPYVESLINSSKPRIHRLVGDNFKIQLTPALPHIQQIQQLHNAFSGCAGSTSYRYREYSNDYLARLSLVLDQKILIPRIHTSRITNNTSQYGINRLWDPTNSIVRKPKFSVNSPMLGFTIDQNSLKLHDDSSAPYLFDAEYHAWNGSYSRSMQTTTGIYSPDRIHDLQLIKATHELNGKTFEFYL